MPSVRQKKGIREASSATSATSSSTPPKTTTQALPRPKRFSPSIPNSATVSTATEYVQPREPARPSVVQSARNKNKPSAHSPATNPPSRRSPSGASPSGVQETRPGNGGYIGARAGVGRVEKSLRGTVRHTLLSDVVRMEGGREETLAGEESDSWRVMILDARATRVISSVLGMYDIMEGHVTVVEDLDKLRQPFHEMEGVYVVSPTTASVDSIKRDFKSESESLYRKVHLFFLASIPRELVQSLKQCSALMARVKTFKEINMDFLVPEAQLFHMDMGSLSGAGEIDAAGHFRELYGGMGQDRVMNSIAERLVTLCASLGEFPHVRFAADGGGRTEGVGKIFQARMEAFVRDKPQWSFRGKDSRVLDGGRATLLILDRADDPLSPLMHEFTYQCLVQDLLHIQDDRISYVSETGKGNMTKEALLNDSDVLWTEFRHQHIAKVLSELGNRFRELVANNSGAAALVKGTGRTMSVKQMAKATRDLPEFRELSKKIAQHVHLSQECMSKLEATNLLQAGDLEQTMALGTDNVGKTRTIKDILEGWVMVEGNCEQPGLLRILKASRTPEEMKLRLIGIFYLSQPKATSEDKRRVLSAAGLVSNAETFLNGLETLAAHGGGATGAERGSESSGGKRGKHNFFKSLGFGGSRSAEESHKYTHMRYTTPFKTTLHKLFTNDASIQALFPSLLPIPAQAPTRKNVGRSMRKGGVQDGGSYEGARVIVYMIGGVLYSEMRDAYEAMHTNSREVIIGGTTLLPAAGFMKGLQGLAK